MKDILEYILKEVPRYETYINQCCAECSSWVEFEQFEDGAYIKYDELEELIKKIGDNYVH